MQDEQMTKTQVDTAALLDLAMRGARAAGPAVAASPSSAGDAGGLRRRRASHFPFMWVAWFSIFSTLPESAAVHVAPAARPLSM